MEDRNLARILAELQAVELPRHVEHAVDHVRELEVGLDLVLREIEPLLADLLHIITIIPGLDRDVLAGPAGERLLLRDLLVHARDGGGPDPHHQFLGARRRARHRVLHPPMGVAFEAEQARALGAHPHDLADRLIGVVGVPIVAAIDEGPPDPLAQRPIVGEGQHRIDRRAGVDDRELAGRQVALARRRRGRVAHVGGDARQIRLADRDEGGLVGQHLLAELREEPRKLLIVSGKLLLLGGVEIGAAADELIVDAGDDALLLRVEAGTLARLIDRADALEEARIEDDLVLRGGEARPPFALQRLIGGRRHVAGHDAEHRADPAQPPPGPLHRLDRVGEGGRRRFAGDRGDLAALLGDRIFEGGREKLGRDPVERRHAGMRARPVGEEDIVGHSRCSQRLEEWPALAPARPNPTRSAPRRPTAMISFDNLQRQWPLAREPKAPASNAFLLRQRRGRCNGAGYQPSPRRRMTRFRISVMSSIAKRMPSRPSPESFTPP